MRLLLQGRHLAPIYGGKTMLSPENRDYLVIDKVPDIFHAGHVHVLGTCNYRGVLGGEFGRMAGTNGLHGKAGIGSHAWKSAGN